MTPDCPPYLFYGSLRHVLSKYEVYEAMCIWEACLLKNVIMIIATVERSLDFYCDG